MTTPTFIEPVDVIAERDRIIAEVQTIVGQYVPSPDGRGDPIYNAVEILMDHLFELTKLINDSGSQTLLEKATGDYLDLIGAITRVPRNAGESDDAYRLRIPLPIINISSGTPDYVLARTKAVTTDANGIAFTVYDAHSVRERDDDGNLVGDSVIIYILSGDPSVLPEGDKRSAATVPSADQILAVQRAMRRDDTQEIWVVYTVRAGSIKEFTINALVTIDGDLGIIDRAVRRELDAHFDLVGKLNRTVNTAGIIDGLVQFVFPDEVVDAQIDLATSTLPAGETAFPFPAKPDVMYKGSIGEIKYHHYLVPTFGFNDGDITATASIASSVGNDAPVMLNLTQDGKSINALPKAIFKRPGVPLGGVNPITYFIEGPGLDSGLSPARESGENNGFLRLGAGSDTQRDDGNGLVLFYVTPDRTRNSADYFTGSYRYYAIDAAGRRSVPISVTITVEAE